MTSPNERPKAEWRRDETHSLQDVYDQDFFFTNFGPVKKQTAVNVEEQAEKKLKRN